MNWFEKLCLILVSTILTIVIATVIVTFCIAQKNGLTFVGQWTEWLQAMHFIKKTAVITLC